MSTGLSALLVSALYQCSRAEAAEPNIARCRSGYPLQQLHAKLCSPTAVKPPSVQLDPQNYHRLRGELSRCLKHDLAPGEVIRLCGVPILPAGSGRKVTT